MPVNFVFAIAAVRKKPGIFQGFWGDKRSIN